METRDHWGRQGNPVPQRTGGHGLVRGEDRAVWGHTEGVCQRYFLESGETRCAVSLSCPPCSGDLAKPGDSSGTAAGDKAP